MLVIMDSLDTGDYSELVSAALREDVGDGDVTSRATIAADWIATASMVAREPIVVCGTEVAEAVFHRMDPQLTVTGKAADGDEVATGTVLMNIAGSARALLAAERTALNFTQRLSGVATAAAHYVQRVAGTGVRILDTRKTTPGWRRLEKYAAHCGGVSNHRFGLFDLILVKDNHLQVLAATEPDPVTAAVRRARNQFPELRIEIEADTPGQAERAARAGADIVLLDNMPLDQLREAVERVARANPNIQTEASGGITLDSVDAVARTGVTFISIGAITHSARAVDIGLDFLPVSSNLSRQTE